MEKRRRAPRVLQPGLVDVAVHPVDRLDLERHVPVQDIGNTARYRHDKLRSLRIAPQGNQPF
jgi:hypothetical protein